MAGTDDFGFVLIILILILLLPFHLNSKMHSTSTAMFPGSGPMPTALRAPTPASPNTSRIS
jgi:hypothetical protein